MGASRLVDLMYLGKTVLVAASVFSCSSGAGHLLIGRLVAAGV